MKKLAIILGVLFMVACTNSQEEVQTMENQPEVEVEAQVEEASANTTQMDTVEVE